MSQYGVDLFLDIHGDEEQQNHYLPRLARGDDIPCFALTGPLAGSDAGAMPDTGIICKGQWQGEEVIGLRLNWEKRYITLGPVATLLHYGTDEQRDHYLPRLARGDDIPCFALTGPLAGSDAGALEIDLKPLLSGVRTEDEGLFVQQHKYWQETMLKATACEPGLIPVEVVQ